MWRMPDLALTLNVHFHKLTMNNFWLQINSIPSDIKKKTMFWTHLLTYSVLINSVSGNLNTRNKPTGRQIEFLQQAREVCIGILTFHKGVYNMYQ